MKKKSSIDLVVMDFLKYIPNPKRNDYELILRRCNFSDVNDPLFPVMLFLLFLQDNLADGTENLAEEVKSLQAKLESGRGPDSPQRSSRWKIVGIVLVSIQIMLSVFCLYKITGLSNYHYEQSSAYERSPYTTEIQKLNFYWDMKLEQAKKERQNNMNEFISNNSLQTLLVAALVFVILLLIVDTVIIYRVIHLIRHNWQNPKSNNDFRHNYRELCSIADGENLLEVLDKALAPEVGAAEGQADASANDSPEKNKE